jgi:hypothetical protein
MDGFEDTVEDAADGMSSTRGTGEAQASVSFVSTITTAVATGDAGRRPNSDASDASDGDDDDEEVEEEGGESGADAMDATRAGGGRLSRKHQDNVHTFLDEGWCDKDST